jgi:hypothetical protein
VHGCTRDSPYVQTYARGPAFALAPGGRGRTEERRRDFLRRSSPCVVLMPHVRRHPGAFLVRCVLRVVRSSAARTAIAAGSSTRSGSPCLSRERRASSAPILRIAARSSGLSGPRGGRRTSRLRALLDLTSSGFTLVGILSVRGHHLPETTRRNGIASLPLLLITAGVVRISARRRPGQYHGVIKSLRNWQACQQHQRAADG